MKFNTRNKIKIETASDYEDVACDIFHEFLDSFSQKPGLLRPATEDDGVDDNIKFMYTWRGARLAERMHDRLCALGEKHFPDGGIHIWSTLYQEC